MNENRSSALEAQRGWQDTSEPVPDGEIIEVMMGATAALMRMYSRGIGSRRDVAARAISALRSHYHITIKRKE